MKRHEQDAALLAAFTARFPEPEPEPYGETPRPVARFATPPAALDELYASLPARLPPLYEELVLTYRWPEVELGSFRLLANPPGPGLAGLLAEMQRDPAFWNELPPSGFIQIGRAPEMNYDPVCFDFRRRGKDGDCRVVQLDHEELLCRFRVREVRELAPSFRELVAQTVRRA